METDFYSRLFILGWALNGVSGIVTLHHPPSTQRPALSRPRYPALRKELLEMVNRDQAARTKAMADISNTVLAYRMGFADGEYTLRLKQIIAKVGWPGKSLVGPDGAGAAWLLVQHADADPAFQKRCLQLMRKAAVRGEIRKPDLALLTDRVLVAEGRKQRYGTQFVWDSHGVMTMRPTEDEPGLERRRRAMGLPPLDEYKKMLEKMYIPPPKKP
jgi:hypothetical protein